MKKKNQTEEEELCNIVDKVEQELGNFKLHHHCRCRGRGLRGRGHRHHHHLDQACSVKMAGYWIHSFFASLWTSTLSWSINTHTKKELDQYPAILT